MPSLPVRGSTNTNKEKYAPDFGTTARLASVLGVPVPYLFSASDELASVIRLFGSLSEKKRNYMINILNTLDTE